MSISSPVASVAAVAPVASAEAAGRVAALVAFTVAVVATPTRSFGAFAVHAATLLTVAALARVGFRRFVTGLTVEVPVLVFAALLPLLGVGPRVDVGPLPLSVEGLWAAWSVLVRASLGVGATTVLLATTPVPDVLAGCARLRLPSQLVAIAGFALRYGEVVRDDARRLRRARLARGDDPRWIWQGRALFASVTVLFVRSYERGERVHRAMLARGYDGTTADLVRDVERGRPSLATRRTAAVVVAPLLAWSTVVLTRVRG